MEEALGFFRAFEVWIYILLGLGALIYIRKFVLSWQELRGAGFGLERDSAQARLNQSASILVLLLTLVVTEFVLVSFLAPTVPGAVPLLTPTMDLLATPTTTLPVDTPLAGEEAGITPTVQPAALPVLTGCLPGEIEITSPGEGEEVSGVVEVAGSADVSSFGFYKLEMKQPDDESWVTILAGDTNQKSGKLGDWDTRRLSPGDYQLSLVIVDNQAQSLPPCIVQVQVARTIEEATDP